MIPSTLVSTEDYGFDPIERAISYRTLADVLREIVSRETATRRPPCACVPTLAFDTVPCAPPEGM